MPIEKQWALANRELTSIVKEATGGYVLPVVVEPAILT